MSTQENQALVRQLLETIWKTSDLSLMEVHPGLHELMPTIQRIMDSGTNIRPTLMEMFGEGEWVAARMLTELPSMMDNSGMPSAGRKLEVIQMFRIADGIILKQHSQAGQIE